MADQTATLGAFNTVLPQLAMTTTAKEYTFTGSNGFTPLKIIACTSEVDWSWSNSAGGVFMPVKAAPNGWKFIIHSGVQSLWFKVPIGTGTLNSSIVY